MCCKWIKFYKYTSSAIRGMARDRKWHSVIVSSNWQASQRCEDPPIEASICHFSSIRNKPHKLWNPTKYLWWINAVNATCKSVTRPSKSSCISNVQFSPENTTRIRKRYSPRTTLSLEILEIPEEALRNTQRYSSDCNRCRNIIKSGECEIVYSAATEGGPRLIYDRKHVIGAKCRK